MIYFFYKVNSYGISQKPYKTRFFCFYNKMIKIIFAILTIIIGYYKLYVNNKNFMLKKNVI